MRDTAFDNGNDANTKFVFLINALSIVWRKFHEFRPTLYFISPRIGIAVGHQGLIIRSEDGGEHWREVRSDAERSDPLLSVWGDYPGQVFAVGSFGQLLVSRNAGLSWQALETPAGDQHFNAIVGDAEGHLLVAGESGLLLRSLGLCRSMPSVECAGVGFSMCG